MKISDFAPRTGAMEFYLTGKNLTGIEIGCDVGAHAESILTHCSIDRLYVVDLFENKWCEGFCEGRLSRWYHRYVLLKGESLKIANKFGVNTMDFVYLDQEHDYKSVHDDLAIWWEKVKEDGITVLRNYADNNIELKKAADEFALNKRHAIESYYSEIIIFK